MFAAAAAFRPALAPYRVEPAQPEMTRGTIRANGADFAYVDGGGDSSGTGEAVILLHAFTGSVDAWNYQLPALVRAGYRVIAYSRRGHRGSSTDQGDRPGRTVDDLAAIADSLGIARFHLVGTAAGGFTALDFAVSRPDRVLTLTISSSQAGIDEPAFKAITAALTPKSFYQLPAHVRELGPSYRAASAEGVARWIAIEETARAPATGIPLKQQPIGWAQIAALEMPCLLLTGAADLYIPPALMARVASVFRSGEFVIIPEAGHAAYWEQPALYNATLLRFLHRHRRRVAR